MPWGCAELRRLGVDPPGRPLTGIRYVAGSASVRASFGRVPGLGIRRTELHAALADRAGDLGVTTLPVAATGLSAPGAGALGVRLADGSQIRGRYVVGADGLRSRVRHWAGLATAPPPGPRRYGLVRHVRVRPWSRDVEVHWAGDLEAYVTPVSDELVGVAVLTAARRPLEAHLERLPWLADRLGSGERVGTDLGAGPFPQAAAAPRAGRVLLVGDAAGYLDALTGEGVALALRQGRALAETVCAAGPHGSAAAYDVQWHRITRSAFALTRLLLAAASHPRLRSRLVPAASAAPLAFRGAVRLLASGPCSDRGHEVVARRRRRAP